MDIGPGSSVVFVGRHGDADTADLSLNTVYFVRDYFQDKLWGSCPRCGDDNLIALEGSRQYKAYDACAFRPYHGPEVEREQWQERKIVEATFTPMFTLQDWADKLARGK